MAGIRSSEGGSLQELIDSYNSELMRLHAQAGRDEPVAAPAAAPSVAAAAAQPSAPAAERVAMRSTIAPDNEALAMRQQPTQRQVAREQAGGQQLAQEQQWLRELEEGLRELEQGLRELEQGLRELEEGERQLELGRAEYMRYSPPQAETAANAYAAPAAAAVSRSDAPTEQGTGIPATDVGNSSETSNQGGYGYLQVFAFTARKARLEQGADVTIIRKEDGQDTLYSVSRTDRSGRTPLIRLPADGRSDSVTPIPSQYYVTVTADNFVPQEELPVEIYQGITATLPVELIPLPESEQVMNRGEQ